LKLWDDVTMDKRKLTNLPASVHQRLLNLAKEMKRPFNELLQYYAMERFLLRLSNSPFADRFVLKGALMPRVWNLPLARPTMDIGMLGRTSNTVENLVEIIQKCVAVEVPGDGVSFDSGSVQGGLSTLVPELNSEAIDFRVASELFAPHRKLQRADLRALRPFTKHRGKDVPWGSCCESGPSPRLSTASFFRLSEDLPTKRYS
jgi:hypothetical protein